jgi:hypothetical protein
MLTFVWAKSRDDFPHWTIVPLITCDQCSQGITDARLAGVAFKTGLRGELETGEPIFLHRACMDTFKLRLPQRTAADFEAAAAGWSADERHITLLCDTWQSRFSWLGMQEWFSLLADTTGADVARYRAARERSRAESPGE